MKLPVLLSVLTGDGRVPPINGDAFRNGKSARDCAGGVGLEKLVKLPVLEFAVEFE
jgi:hypothetical protein